jgi:integrase
MTQELRKVARLIGAGDWQQVDWTTLDAAKVAAIMAKVSGAPSSRRKTLAALKGVAKSAWRMKLMDAESLARINDIRGDRGHREPKGRAVEAWELAALMRTCAADPTPAGARDGCMVAIAAKTGARRAELVGIDYEHITFASDHTAEISVLGKGDKERVLYLDNGDMDALDDWLAVRGCGLGALFFAIDKIGKLYPEHRLTTTAAHKILIKRAEEAGITSPLTWHDFRRTFAGNLLDAGEDIATVSALMGHSNSNTTQKYDRRPAEVRRKAARKISIPHFKRAAQV